MQYTPKPATATTSPKFDPLGFVWVHSFSDISIKIEESDDEWHHTIEEAAAFQTGSQLRWLFVRILLNCHSVDPLNLCDDHHLHLSDDCSHLLTTKYGIETPSNDQIKSLP